MAQLESDLYYAIEAGNEELLKRHLSAGADPSTVFWGSCYLVGSHWSALHICCQKGLYGCAKCLIDAGAKLDIGDGLQQTPLFYCVHWEWWELMELLIEAGCDINTVDGHGRTPLHCAVDCTDTRPLKLLIEAGADINQRNHMGRTALWMAASKNGKLEFIKHLLEANADINMPDAEEKATPLQAALAHAAGEDKALYVDLFLSWGASVQATSEDSATPIQTIIIRSWSNGPKVYEEELHFITTFIRKGTDLNHVVERRCKNYLKGTALKMAAERGCLPIIKLLLEAGADVEKTYKEDETPLLVASYNGHTSIVKELLRHNPNLNTEGLVMIEKEYRKLNAFQCALQQCHLDIGELLVYAGYNLAKERYLWTNEVVPKQLVLNLDFWCWLQDVVSQPMTLAEITRRRIRILLGHKLKGVVIHLGLPMPLKRYILDANP